MKLYNMDRCLIIPRTPMHSQFALEENYHKKIVFVRFNLLSKNVMAILTVCEFLQNKINSIFISSYTANGI